MDVSPLCPWRQLTRVQHMFIKWGSRGPGKERSCDQAAAQLTELQFQGGDPSMVLTGRAGTVPVTAVSLQHTSHNAHGRLPVRVGIS